MSISRQITVWCDKCVEWEQASLTALQLREELKRKGWTQEGKKDFCPTCSDEQVRRTNVFDERGGGD